MKEAKPGDKVVVVTSRGEFQGTLLPRPSLLSQDILVLKLPSGYNIGIASSTVKKITVVEPYSTPVATKQKIPFKKELPTVAILSTGGTIASRVDYRTGGVYADYTAEDFLAM